MAWRFLFSFTGILVYLGVWSLALWGVIAFGSDEFAFMIPVIAVLCVVCLPIFLDVCAKYIFFFRGQGVPTDEKLLRAELLSVNVKDLPITVHEKGNSLIFTWKYLDAKWWEIIRKTGVMQSFEVIIKLDSKRKRATLIDISRSIRWGVGPEGVRFGGSFFRGIFLGYSIGTTWGVRENFTMGKIYDFRFRSVELHNPVMNTILRNGWDVRFGLF